MDLKTVRLWARLLVHLTVTKMATRSEMRTDQLKVQPKGLPTELPMGQPLDCLCRKIGSGRGMQSRRGRCSQPGNNLEGLRLQSIGLSALQMGYCLGS